MTKHSKKFRSNKVSNNRYTYWNFIILGLFNQFKYFYNLYFLVTALSQFIPILQVGYRFTYTMPLAFVVILAMAKDAYDDIWIRIGDKVCSLRGLHTPYSLISKQTHRNS